MVYSGFNHLHRPHHQRQDLQSLGKQQGKLVEQQTRASAWWTQPALVQALWATRDPQGFFAAKSRGQDLFEIRLPGFAPIFATGRPSGVREIFAAPAEAFASVAGSPIGPVLGEGSLMIMEGARHGRERRLMMPCFGPAKIQALCACFAAVAAAELERLPSGMPFSLQAMMQRITLRVIIDVIFGVKDPDEQAIFTAVMDDFVAACTPSLLFIPSLRHGAWAPWRRFLAAQQRLDTCLSQHIRSVRAGGATDDFSLLQVLMTAQGDDGKMFSDDELRDELRTLLVAGHETTATGLTWALYHLLEQSELLLKLELELASVGPGPAEGSALFQLPYLSAVCHEALRIYPVAPFAIRALKQPLSICGRTLQPGQNIAAALIVLHADGDLYPHPACFRPERFLERKFAPHEYAPFGGGFRRCIGALFAQAEMRVILATLLRGARFTLVEAPPPRLVTRHINSGPDRVIQVRLASHH